jgi:hypothetical protein
MLKWVIASALGLLVIVLVGTQIALPPIISSRIDDRLTKAGGTADASIKAIPALRLVFHDGDKLKVRANRVRIPIAELGGGGFKDLDGFDEVDLRLTDYSVGPFRSKQTVIDRPEGTSLYDFAFTGSTSANELSNFALSALPPALAALIGGLVDRTSRLGTAQIPIRLVAQLKSDNGTAQLVRGTGTVAGIPLGPLAVSIAGAIVSRITS